MNTAVVDRIVTLGARCDPARFDPKVVTYGVRALAWDTIDRALTTFEKMPSG